MKPDDAQYIIDLMVILFLAALVLWAVRGVFQI